MTMKGSFVQAMDDDYLPTEDEIVMCLKALDVKQDDIPHFLVLLTNIEKATA